MRPHHLPSFTLGLIALLVGHSIRPSAFPAQAVAPRPAAVDAVAQAGILDSLKGMVDSLQFAASYQRAGGLAREAVRIAGETAAAGDSAPLSEWLRRSAALELELGRFTDAESLFRRALGIETRSRCDSASILDALRGFAAIVLERGDLAEGERGALFCLRSGARINGPRSVEAAKDMMRMAEVRMRQQRFADAESLLAEAESVSARQTGPDRDALVDVLRLQAELAFSRARYQDARALFARSLALAEEIHGAGSDPATLHLNVQAKVQRRLGELGEARECYKRCLQTRQRVYGAESPHVGAVLHDLGVLLYDMGDYEEAVRTAERALAIRSASFGPKDARVALTMVTLGRYLQGVGRYAEAIRVARDAAERMEAAQGSAHPQTALALSRLAGLLLRRGDILEADRLYRRSLRITESVYGDQHPEVASHCMNLGLCLLEQGRVDEARVELERSVRTGRAVYGSGSARTAVFERELARALAVQGKVDEAIAVLDACVANQQGQLGAENPNLIATLSRLAEAELIAGRIAEGRAHSARTIDLGEKIYGAEHMNLVGPLLTAAELDAAEGKWREAVAKGIRATQIALAVQEEAYRGSSDEEALQVLGLAARAVTTLCGLLPLREQCPDTTLERVFCLLARTHGQVLDRMAERHRLIESGVDPGSASLQAGYLAACQRLANLVGKELLSPETSFHEETRRARAEKEEAERALSVASDEFRERLERRKQEAAMTCDRLAEILPPGGGIVHFVRYPDLAAGARSAARQMASPILPLPSAAAERYGAFCLAASAPGAWTLSFHDLGEADFLDTLIVSYRRSVEGEGGSGRPSARAEAEFRVASRSLHRRAWEPIAARFAEAGPVGPEPGAAIVLLIPDSELLLVDFNTLLSPADELVIERWSLHNLSSARDLLRLAEQTRAGAREGLLAVGCSGPDPAAAPMTRRPASTLRSARPCDIDPRSLPPLSGAVDEARRISDLYSRASGEPVTLLVGPEATEGSAKRLMGSSRIIHLAAHGFFCGREAGDGGAVTRDAAEDPLLLSGLVLLAGPAGDDGILFAQEVVGRDMRGTDWAVLSACASGRGVQLFGDGLSGLRRAFEIAGVRTVLTSMWHIRDDVARDLMVRLYTHRLSGESTVEAVRGAQLERLREVRSRFRRIHPALWGGIVAEGDWR